MTRRIKRVRMSNELTLLLDLIVHLIHQDLTGDHSVAQVTPRRRPTEAVTPTFHPIELSPSPARIPTLLSSSLPKKSSGQFLNLIMMSH
jgi:hypothetical protein